MNEIPNPAYVTNQKLIFRTFVQLCTAVSRKLTNRPFPSCPLPHFQKESSCETIQMKMSLICMKMDNGGRAGENRFHVNVFTRRLVLTQRQKVTRKWPIIINANEVFVDCELAKWQFT